MRKLTVLVDMDDCIEKLSFAWSKYLNHKYGLNVPYEAVNQFSTFSKISNSNANTTQFNTKIIKIIIYRFIDNNFNIKY